MFYYILSPWMWTILSHWMWTILFHSMWTILSPWIIIIIIICAKVSFLTKRIAGGCSRWSVKKGKFKKISLELSPETVKFITSTDVERQTVPYHRRGRRKSTAGQHCSRSRNSQILFVCRSKSSARLIVSFFLYINIFEQLHTARRPLGALVKQNQFRWRSRLNKKQTGKKIRKEKKLN